ncbi:MAG: hypothetical protein P8Y94_10085 [Acidobacteriota bacterium]
MAEKTHTWLYLVLGGSLGLLLATIWSFHYLPLTDLPEHVLAAKVLVDYEDPGTCYSSFYTVETPWKPYSATFFWSARLLAPVVTPLHAAKLYLSLSLVLTIVGIGFWLKAVAPGQMVQLIPATMLLYSSFFFVGMLNTLFAVPFFFFALWSCHEILKKGPTSPFYDVGLAVCLLLIYFSHITVFGAAILVLGTLWLFSPNRRRGWRLALAAAPSVGLTLAYFLLTTSKGVHTLLNISYDPILLRASSLLVPFNAVFDRVNHVWVYEPDQLVIDILLGILIVLGTVVGSRRSAFRSEGGVSNRHVVVVALSLLWRSPCPSCSPITVISFRARWETSSESSTACRPVRSFFRSSPSSTGRDSTTTRIFMMPTGIVTSKVESTRTRLHASPTFRFRRAASSSRPLRGSFRWRRSSTRAMKRACSTFWLERGRPASSMI